MTPAPRSAFDWEGQTVLDRAGEKIGTIKEIFLVEETGSPEWALVKVGRLKSHTTLVPLMRARSDAKGVRIAYEKGIVDEAPKVDPDDEPSEEEVQQIYRHYGIDLGDEQQADASPSAGNGAGAPQQKFREPGGGEVVHGSPDRREEPIGDLLKSAKDEASTFVKKDIELAKAEMGTKAKEAGIGAGMFGGAGYFGHLAMLGFMLCVIFALATAMQAWLAALIVTVVFAAIAGALVLAGKKKIEKAGPPVPEQAVEAAKQTIQNVKEEAKWGLGKRT